MTNDSLTNVESIAECSPWSILQYFLPALKAGILYPPVGEWLQYETISRWGLTTV